MSTLATRFLEGEARALLTRLDRVRPFVINETMVPAAAPSPAAMSGIERLLLQGRRALRGQVMGYLSWLRTAGTRAPAAEAQRRFTVIRMAFNDTLSQFDLFTEVVTQRSEQTTGVWLSGLDALASDALQVTGGYFEPPPIMCYLARGPGAAIRRARTRLPGGADNPVAIIRVPRERMIGHGIASSLVHEVGHQGAALLGLVESLRPALKRIECTAPPRQREAWSSFHAWISEIVADLWSVSRLGIGSTLGLLGVVSLPRWFVFRPSGTDPHPVPWIRVRLSCSIGQALYPDPQWGNLSRLWAELYPLQTAPEGMRRTLSVLDSALDDFVGELLTHRPTKLRGTSIGDALVLADRSSRPLVDLLSRCMGDPRLLSRISPTLAFAAIGQGRAAGKLAPELEGELIADLLTGWAIRTSLDTSALCAEHSAARPQPTSATAFPPRRHTA